MVAGQIITGHLFQGYIFKVYGYFNHIIKLVIDFDNCCQLILGSDRFIYLNKKIMNKKRHQSKILIVGISIEIIFIL